MKKNIIYLLIDSMCEEDLIFIKKNIKKFPGFKYFLSNNSIEFQNTYSVSIPTEPTVPTIFTGELPLNKKTYEFGIKYFRKDFFLALKKNRYDFLILSNAAIISEMMGYTKNLVKIKLLSSVEHTWMYFRRVYCWNYLNGPNHFKNRVKIFKNKFKQFLEHFELHLGKDQSWFSKKIGDLDNKKIVRIKQKILSFKKEIRKINEGTIERHLKRVIDKDFFEFFGEATWKHKFINIFIKIFKSKNLRWKHARINLISHQIRLKNITTDIDRVLAETLDYIKKRKKNFFIFSHILDLHHDNFSENNFLLKMPKKNRFKHKHLYGDEREHTLSFIDKHIKIFIEKIPQEVLKKSCVCISSDHGTASDENNEGPLNTKLVSGLFAERFLKIPLLIYLPGNKKKMKNNKSLTNSSNIIPILMKLSNLRINNYIKKLSDVNKQKYIYAEHTHRGPAYGNLINGQVYNCVITKDFKIIKKSKISSFDNNNEKEIFIRNKNDNINSFNEKKFNKKKFLPYINKVLLRQKTLLKKFK